MPVYTTAAKVKSELPDSLPSGWEAANMTTLIADASGQVEDLVGPSYAFTQESNAQKFPEITSDPATPAMIEYCARLLAASMGYANLKEQNKLSGKDLETKLRTKAQNYLQQIREGEIVISLSGSNMKTNPIGHTTDQHIYPDDGDADDPIFNDDNFSSFI